MWFYGDRAASGTPRHAAETPFSDPRGHAHVDRAPALTSTERSRRRPCGRPAATRSVSAAVRGAFRAAELPERSCGEWAEASVSCASTFCSTGGGSAGAELGPEVLHLRILLRRMRQRARQSQVTHQSRVVVEDAQHDGRYVRTARFQHLLPAGIEIGLYTITEHEKIKCQPLRTDGDLNVGTSRLQIATRRSSRHAR